MKYILSFFAVILIGFSIFAFREDSGNSDYFRIHVTANSNSAEDENIKYFVKDAVLEFLSKELEMVENEDQAQNVILENLQKIETIANMVLKTKNVDYRAKVFVDKENIPARVYGDVVCESGVYKSLQIQLGKAEGDNWWCVVFPAVCFVSSKNSTNYEYISKILEIINNVKS